MYSLIEEIIANNKYSSLDVVCHFPLNMLIKNPELLNKQECQYAMNPATHLDFLIYNRIGKNLYKNQMVKSVFPTGFKIPTVGNKEKPIWLIRMLESSKVKFLLSKLDREYKLYFIVKK